MTYIYFAQEGEDGPIKIGISVAPWQRRRQLSNARGQPVWLWATVEGDALLEWEIHKLFKAHALGREWFSPAPEIWELIHGIGQVCLPPGRTRGKRITRRGRIPAHFQEELDRARTQKEIERALRESS